MKVTNEELAKLVTTLSSIMAGMLEMNAKIARAVVPLNPHLGATEKRELMAYLENVPQIVNQLRGACDQIKTHLSPNSALAESEGGAEDSEDQEVLSGPEFEKLKAKADAGDPEAQYDLGKLYSVEGEEQEAAKWFLKAAERGFAPAQYQIGICYDAGSGLIKDEEKAYGWFRQAAGQGFQDAIHELGSFLIRRDAKEGIDYFRALAEQGDTYAQARLAWLFGDNDEGMRDDEEAFRWYLKSAETGDTTNEYVHHFLEVGRRYVLGEGTKKDIGEGIKWLTKTGDPESTRDPYNLVRAQYLLGLAYSEADFPEKDFVKAYSWLSLALSYKSVFDADEYADFWPTLVSKRNALGRLISHEQGEQAQQVASELFVPWNEICFRTVNARHTSHSAFP